ncbi:GAF domain-containing protein [Methylobacterium sp. CM6257]|jgi:hypothetical protein
MSVPPRRNACQRAAALDRLQIMDTPPEPAFDRIVRAAQKLFNAPIALISLLDDERQWFKAKCGLDAQSTPRELAFCNYTVLHDSVFVVPDAQAEAAFASNPLVTGHPFIRFYAGAPLTLLPGVRLGSLCIIDTKPRTFSTKEAQLLARLAQVVVDEFWLRDLVTTPGKASVSAEAAKGDLAPPPLITGIQVRAARALLGWSVSRLAVEAALSPNTIKRFEAEDCRLPSSDATISALKSALEANDIVFIGHDTAAPGVQLLRK